MKADLHNHSIYSDGILTPLELANYAKEKELDIIAITDHDSVQAFEESIKDSSITFIKGVELSTFHNGENIHLLGYFINNEVTPEIKKILIEYEEARKNRIYKIIDKLKEHYNLDLTYEEITKYGTGVIGRVHVAKALTEKYGITQDEAFNNYIGNNQKGYVKTKNLELKDAIDILHQNNAIAVLAHPIKIKENNIEELIALGLDGIEAHYYLHTPEDEIKYLDLAEKYNLLVTGGSDFHKFPEKETDRDMAKATLKGKELTKFLKRINVDIKE